MSDLVPDSERPLLLARDLYTSKSVFALSSVACLDDANTSWLLQIEMDGKPYTILVSKDAITCAQEIPPGPNYMIDMQSDTLIVVKKCYDFTCLQPAVLTCGSCGTVGCETHLPRVETRRDGPLAQYECRCAICRMVRQLLEPDGPIEISDNDLAARFNPVCALSLNEEPTRELFFNAGCDLFESIGAILAHYQPAADASTQAQKEQAQLSAQAISDFMGMWLFGFTMRAAAQITIALQVHHANLEKYGLRKWEILARLVRDFEEFEKMAPLPAGVIRTASSEEDDSVGDTPAAITEK